MLPPTHQPLAQIPQIKSFENDGSEAVLQHKLSIKRFSTVNISKEFKIGPDMEFAFKSMSKRLLKILLNNFYMHGKMNCFCDICNRRVTRSDH